MSNIANLSNEIAKSLSEYTDEVKEKIKQASDEVSKEAVDSLKQDSPKLTGKYAKGWSRKKTQDGYVVYNRTDYQLTHLLENGHAKRGGGRVEPKVHIKPVEEKSIADFEKRIEKAIQG